MTQSSEFFPLGPAFPDHGYSMNPLWLSVPGLAALADIGRQTAHDVVKRASSNPISPWRDALLITRQVKGRGGRSGWSYEVRLDSLPVDLQARFKELQTPFQHALKHDGRADAERNWWASVLRPASIHPRHSEQRGIAIRAIVAADHIREGNRVRVAERTVQRKLASFDASGFAGLTRKKRVDAGEKAVFLTRVWDRAVQLDDVTKAAIGHELRQYVRGMIKAGESPSMLQMEAALHLAELTRAAGFDPGHDLLTAACAIPASLIKAEGVFRKAHVFKADKKAYHDKLQPRTLRNREGYRPNDVWVMDVHPLDIGCLRADGSKAYARGIATLDLSTNRVFVTWRFYEKGRGVTNRDVIEHFIANVAAWGMPRALYLDNGSEFNWADFIGDALKLIDQDGRRLIGDIAPWAERRSNLVRAQAYNAPAKPIEGIFGVLERKHFHIIPGWEGGERWRKKTANHGREPDPFPGTAEQLDQLLALIISVYNSTPQFGSALAGQSPHGRLKAEIEAGWGKVAVEADTFRLAFAIEDTREVRQGGISFKGRRWTSRELQAYQGGTVTILAPKYEPDATRLPCRDERGQWLGILTPDVAYGFLDPAGAQEARARTRVHAQAARALDRSVPDQVPLLERMKLAASMPGAPDVPTQATLKPSKEAAAFVAHYTATPKERADRDLQERLQRAAEDQKRIEEHSMASRRYTKRRLPGCEDL